VADYPPAVVAAGHVEPSPRRIRVIVDGRLVVDTCAAWYVWEHSHYPRYHVPVTDIAAGALVDEPATAGTEFGSARRFGLRAGTTTHPDCVRVFTAPETWPG
jgi:uncharacterized protein (DUF427 family)